MTFVQPQTEGHPNESLSFLTALRTTFYNTTFTTTFTAK